MKKPEEIIEAIIQPLIVMLWCVAFIVVAHTFWHVFGIK